MKYKNTTFVKILLIYSHYKPGKPFLKGAPFFWRLPVYINECVVHRVCFPCAFDKLSDGLFCTIGTLRCFP